MAPVWAWTRRIDARRGDRWRRKAAAALSVALAAALEEQFDVVLDCGLFHVFDDADRAAFVDSLRTAMRPGSRYHLLCFSDRLPGGFGPRRVSQQEIRTSFQDGWQIESIEAATIETIRDPNGVPAWHATISRTAAN